MTWPNRLELLFGLIVVFAVVAGGTIVFTQRQNSVQSATASIDAENVTVGAVYAGTVVDQLVEPGDVVAVGDPLLVVRSTQLARDLEEEVIAAEDLTGVDATAGTYQIVATVAGTVDQIDAPMGDFVVGAASPPRSTARAASPSKRSSCCRLATTRASRRARQSICCCPTTRPSPASCRRSRSRRSTDRRNRPSRSRATR